MLVFFIILLFVGSIIDLQLFLISVQSGKLNIVMYVIIHLFLSLCIYIFYRFEVKKKIEMPLYFMIFIPIFGFVFTTIFYLALLVFNRKGNLVEDYETYINYVSDFIVEKDIDFHKEINTTTALDYLLIGDDEQKKSVIIDLVNENMDIKIDILKKALKDNNSEVVHYASSTLNLIENEYEKSLDHLKNKYKNEKGRVVLQELIDVYGKYIYSGLNENFLRNIYLEEYIEMIDTYIDEYGYIADILIKKVNALLVLKKYDRALDVLNIMDEKFPHNFDRCILRMRLFYYLKDYNEIRIVINKMEKMHYEIPMKYKQIVDFWDAKENN